MKKAHLSMGSTDGHAASVDPTFPINAGAVELDAPRTCHGGKNLGPLHEHRRVPAPAPLQAQGSAG